ncbi:snf2 family helicase [Grosmannia clavigera kw1407]|uniref:Snf2 family helicase n=1 Tax=Grosmannia clavigera (strain kw1407 / UAMH 11150) TaxID=655863 RepID=F0XI61_GROCL|nr:snf2 family helicase [Grosmannia clavigera kw1407]EFX02741.1 snf2 family helicase [Grosmannia clavigera kw1407]
MAPPAHQPNGSQAPPSPPVPCEDMQLGIYAPPAAFPLSFVHVPHLSQFPARQLHDPSSTNQDCPQGRQDLHYGSSSTPSNDLASWNAAVLLDPRSHAFPPESRPQTPDSIHSSATNTMAGLESAAGSVSGLFLGDGHGAALDPGSSHSSEVTFRFMTPSAGGVGTGTPPTSFLGGPDFGGMASLIEQGYHLKDRSDVPEPKRRKVDLFSGGSSSGILADSLHSDDSKEDVKVSSEALAPAKNPVTVDLTGSADNNPVGTDAKDAYHEVCYGMLTGVSVDCHKLPVPKPGIQAIGGPAYWPAVKIVLRRIDNDRTNTIQVYDHTREVFGSLDKRSANCLTPLMDISKVHLRTDARIPSRRKSEDEEAGQPISKSYRIELVLYGASTFAKPVWKRVAGFGFGLVTPHRVQPGIRLMLPQEPLVLSPKPSDGQLSSSSSSTAATRPPLILPPTFQTRTMEDIRSEVMAVFDSLAHTDDLPEMEPDSCVLTPLLRHQKQGLYFMTTRETPLAQQHGNKYMSSIWTKKPDRSGCPMYHNVITDQLLSQPPPESLGGILADMMGLGKTLSILSLIATSRQAAEQWSRLAPEQPTEVVRKKKAAMSRNFELPVPQELGLTQLRRNGRGTLLVCPLSTITNWEEQVKQHLAADALSFHVYHGQNRIKDVAQLSEFDLVITTYGSVSSELTARNRGKAGPFPLEEIGWFRIVLDEAHMIREPSTLQFKAITRLQASRRWAVTGTPVQNRLEDLGSLLSFLRLQPFHDRAKFAHHIVNRFRACDPDVLPQLRILVDTITLRRLKDKIDLPPRTDVTMRLDFAADEKEIYDFFERDANDRVKALTSQSERLLGGKTYIHILQAILRLRLICAHGKDLLGDDDLQRMQTVQRETELMLTLGTSPESAINLDDDEDEEKNGRVKGPPSESKLYEIYDLLVNSNSDNCVICKRKLSSLEDMSANIRSEKQEDVVGYMTPCYHLYCPDCITHFCDEERGATCNSGQPGRCPYCRDPVLFACPEIRRDRADGEHDAPGHSRDLDEGSDRAARPPLVHGSPAASRKPVDLKAYSGPHTKTRALLADLLDHERESGTMPDEQPIKSVVFSGWTSHLDLIERALRDNGIAFCRLDGKMSRTARTQAMDTFRDDPSVHVILVSIMAGGLGLNLTAGNYVYVMEPQYNPAAEAQAIDRVHRLGQKRPVHTVRFIMNRSFEERMLEIQADKIKLANLSLNRDRMGVADAARQRLHDLRRLFR